MKISLLLIGLLLIPFIFAEGECAMDPPSEIVFSEPMAGGGGGSYIIEDSTTEGQEEYKAQLEMINKKTGIRETLSITSTQLKIIGYILLTIVTIIAITWIRKKTNGGSKHGSNDNQTNM